LSNEQGGLERLFLRQQLFADAAFGPLEPHRACLGAVRDLMYLPAAFSGYIFAALVGWVGWYGAALLQMCLLLLVPIIAMLFFDLGKTSCKTKSRTVPAPQGPFRITENKTGVGGEILGPVFS
jgi:hypothetical protein